MDKLDQSKIKKFYNSTSQIWANYDMWHLYSKKIIENIINKNSFKQLDYVLNAGSGGNSYNQTCRMHHVDIADEKIANMDEFTVASIENLPFEDTLFDGILCVGSVINYCDAMATISEFSRVLKEGGKLILEYENSWSFEYRNKLPYKSPATIVTTIFQKESHKNWIFSYRYINNILKSHNFKILKTYRFHILSPFMLSKGCSEEEAAKYAKFDKILQHIPFVNRHSSNVLLICKKITDD